MSLTSYRAAPPRVNHRGKLELTEFKGPPNERAARAARSPVGGPIVKEKISTCVWQTWQRPTLPRLETKYHQRWSVSRPSSEWDRVQPLRHNHQVGKTHVVREAFERRSIERCRQRSCRVPLGAVRWSCCAIHLTL